MLNSLLPYAHTQTEITYTVELLVYQNEKMLIYESLMNIDNCWKVIFAKYIFNISHSNYYLITSICTRAHYLSAAASSGSSLFEIKKKRMSFKTLNGYQQRGNKNQPTFLLHIIIIITQINNEGHFL